MTDTNTRPFTAASFNQFLAEKMLMGSRCKACGALSLPPRAICADCQGEEMEWVEMAGRGKLAAFTSVYIGPSVMNTLGFGRDNPYVTGIVELEEGVKISARVLGVDAKNPASIQVGLPLTVEYIQQGEGQAQKTILAFQAQ